MCRLVMLCCVTYVDFVAFNFVDANRPLQLGVRVGVSACVKFSVGVSSKICCVAFITSM